jgi:YVTN family beta-propeller protein
MTFRSFRAVVSATLVTGIVTNAALASQSTGPTGTLVVANMNDNTATVLNAATGATIATLPTGEGPHEVAISHDGRWALVSNYGIRGKRGNSLTVIDVASATVNRTITLEGYQSPHGMAFLPGDSIVAVTGETKQAVLLVDFRTGAIKKTLGTRGRATHMVSMTSRGDRLYTANIVDGTVSELNLATGDSARLIRVARQSEGIAVAPDGRSVWAGSNADSVVLVVDLARPGVVDTLRGFGLPYRIAISRDSRVAVVSDPMRGEVRAFTVADRKPKWTIAIPADSLVATAEVAGSSSPEGVAISSDGRWAFVTLQGRNRVITIDIERGVVTRYAVIGTWADGIGYSPLKPR